MSATRRSVVRRSYECVADRPSYLRVMSARPSTIEANNSGGQSLHVGPSRTRSSDRSAVRRASGSAGLDSSSCAIQLTERRSSVAGPGNPLDGFSQLTECFQPSAVELIPFCRNWRKSTALQRGLEAKPRRGDFHESSCAARPVLGMDGRVDIPYAPGDAAFIGKLSEHCVANWWAVKLKRCKSYADRTEAWPSALGFRHARQKVTLNLSTGAEADPG